MRHTDVIGKIEEFLNEKIYWFFSRLPLIVLVFALIEGISFYQYPKFAAPGELGFLLLLVFPTIINIVLEKIKREKKWKQILQVILFCLSLLSIPFVAIFSGVIVNCSETTDVSDYCQMDATCDAVTDPLFYQLFPLGNIGKKESYYYKYYEFLDGYCHVYAEMSVDKETMEEEVLRVKEAFDGYEPSEYEGDDYYRYADIRKGDYQCMFFYHTDNPENQLFEDVNEETTHAYEYYMFAYDEENGKVRYGYSSSLTVVLEQPYYLSLEW